MKNLLTTLIVLALSLTFATRGLALFIEQDPQSRSNNIGDNAYFTVTASGTGELSYQWKKDGVNIPDATDSELDVLVMDVNQAGTYTVVVTDDFSSLESMGAELTIPFPEREIVAQWRFNQPPYTGVATSEPDIGSGSVGSTAGVWEDSLRAGTTSDPASTDPEAVNNARSVAGPRQAAGNKAAGLIINFSTEGYKDIAITFEQNVGGRASGYWRGQYSVDGGISWIDGAVVDKRQAWSMGQTGFTFHLDDLSEVEGVRNNPIFAYRIVAEWESTATGFGADALVPANADSTYNNTGNPTSQWDMITVMGISDDIEEEPFIHVQPQSQLVFVGGDATFSVIASGGNLEYQWRFEGADISGATESSYTRENVQFSDAGAYSVFISNSQGDVTSDDAILTVEESLPAGERFWSANGTTQGGAGVWDDSTPNRWGLQPEGPFNLPWSNANPDSATFGGEAGGVALESPIMVNRITSIAGYGFAGPETLIFAGEEAGVEISGGANTVTISTKVEAEEVHKTGSGRLFFSNNPGTQSSEIGRFIVTGGTISGAPAALGMPEELVSDYFVLDGGFLGLETVGADVGATRGIYLGPNGGTVAARPGATLSIPGPITGPGGINFPSSNFGAGVYGGNIPYVVSNQANDYEGNTTVGRGELRLGNDEVLPDTTTLTLSGSNGRLNLNGHTETIAGLVISSSNVGRVIDEVGGGVLIAGHYDLRGGGNSSGVLGGDADLIKTTSGAITLGGANTYTGDTFFREGTVILNGIGRFGSGEGTLYLEGSEGPITLTLSESRTEENTLVNPIVFSAAEATIQSHIDAGEDIVFRHSGSWTTEGGLLYLWNASLYSFDVMLSGEFDFTSMIDIGLGVQLTSSNPEGTEQVYSGGLAGSGSFQRSASGAGGRTVFKSDNSYSGDTRVEAGTLLVNNESGSGTGFGEVVVGGPGGMLGGTGFIAGGVAVNEGGSISPGDGVGILTLQNGLNMSGGGTMIWELGALRDDSDGVAGADFNQLVLTGGELNLGGSSKLLVQFADGSAPDPADPFWQSSRSWTIVSLAGGQNFANATFDAILNGSTAAGNFSTSVDGSGSIILTFAPGEPAGPVITAHPQSRTNIEGTTATFTVEATGLNLTYEWFRSDNPFTAIAGASEATFVIAAVESEDAGAYFARVSNELGNATSSEAMLTVAPVPGLEVEATAGATEVSLTWSTVPGVSYRLEYTASLTNPEWITLANFVAETASFTHVDEPPSEDNERYYRLVIQP